MNSNSIQETLFEVAKSRKINDLELMKHLKMGRTTFYYHKKRGSFSVSCVLSLCELLGMKLLLLDEDCIW